jgi:phospholipid/cholesterol/gamma-HCH transport system permease protein
MTASAPSKPYTRLRRSEASLIAGWMRIGAQTRFYAKTLGAIPDAVVNYRTELMRLIAQMGWVPGPWRWSAEPSRSSAFSR